MSAAIKLPSMLAFERKLETSDALMFSGSWDDREQLSNWSKISITQRKNRSTQSAYGTKDSDKDKPNPVSSDNDDANLLYDDDTLKVCFSMRVVGGIGTPFGCNDPQFSDAIKEKVDADKPDGLKEISYRYAYNIAAGRFLWRNRVGAEEISINVEIDGGDSFSFDGYDFSLKNFEGKRGSQDLVKLADAIFTGLSEEEKYVCLNVNAYVKLGNGQHVFPSQEMNMGEKKKVLFQLDECAAMHSVKIGNAIRTIDDWYPEAKFPIAVEPFGAVTQQGQAYRRSKVDLYTLMMNWVNNKEMKDQEKYFVMANLIRGGVFGGKSE